MTDNEIIKALECCASSTTSEACDGCPLNTKEGCETHSHLLESLALDLINRQRALIKAMTQSLKAMSNIAKAERHEAYKVFAEKLKQRASLGEFPWDDLTVTTDQIDDLVKEMVGEKNDRT